MEVGLAVDVVADGVGGGVVEEGVDGEVAAQGVFAGVGEGDALGVAAVGIGGVGAKGGDVHWRVVGQHDGDDAEGFADGDGAREGRFDFFGVGAGDDVPILGRAFQEQVADAAAHQPSFVAVAAERLQDGQRRGWDGCFQAWMSA